MSFGQNLTVEGNSAENLRFFLPPIVSVGDGWRHGKNWFVESLGEGCESKKCKIPGKARVSHVRHARVRESPSDGFTFAL